ncbi:MAG: DUF6328 family protein [Solirubrobacterales bacterium]
MTQRPPGSPRDETDGERLDRNLGELLQELRIALPGVQVLFAFLLAVPFQRRFDEVTDFQKSLFFATLLLTALSTILFIAPTAFHRFTFRRQQKERLVRLGNKLTIAGVAALGLAMTGAVALITDFLYSSTATIITTALVLLMFVSFWILLPLHGRRQADGS